MKNLILAYIISTLLLSCNNDDDLKVSILVDSCGKENPIEDLAWLKTKADEIKFNEGLISKHFYIEIGTYQGRTVFSLNNCWPICNTAIPIFNCNGENLGNLNTDIKSK